MIDTQKTTIHREHPDAREYIARALFAVRPKSWRSADWSHQPELTREQWRKQADRAISELVDSILP